jgi:hypothetical protein
MRKTVLNFSFSRVRKSEIPEIMNAILEIVEKHDPTALNIVGMYNLLLELKPLLDKLTLKYDGYPIPEALADLRITRNNLLGAILSQLTAIEKAKVVSLAQQAAQAVPYLRSYLDGIINENARVKTGRVNQLFTNLDDFVTIKAAFVGLGLNVYIEELRACQQSINQSESLRREAMSVRIKQNTLIAKEKISYAVGNLLDAIELGKVEHTDIDYMPLINELNVLLSSRQSLIKSRVTRSKNSIATKTTTVAPSTTTSATVI